MKAKDIKIDLTKEDKDKYKNMELEEIISDIKTRTDAPRYDLINCAKWIMEKCQFEQKSEANKTS